LVVETLNSIESAVVVSDQGIVTLAVGKMLKRWNYYKRSYSLSQGRNISVAYIFQPVSLTCSYVEAQLSSSSCSDDGTRDEGGVTHDSPQPQNVQSVHLRKRGQNTYFLCSD